MIEHKGICEENRMKDKDHRIDIYYHPESPDTMFEVATYFAREETAIQSMRSFYKEVTLVHSEYCSFSLCEMTEFAQLVAYMTWVLS